MSTPHRADVPIRPFADFLREQSRGTTHDELSEGLHDLVQRVRDTGKKGAITLVISVELMKGSDKAVIVSDEIKLKLPEHDRDTSLFFADRNGNLVRNDPDQLAFESLREAPPPPGVDLKTGEMTGTAD
ncbi:MAG TPA: hypothetical protein VFJ94_03950 [Intrasporangium sp.]|uniref:hypothetical protein n=1 Tax=Intrasporangium sp. TaxID=1925024 RepID=UPI002D792D6D|nr:hypothetical protein [Intrasporangium sp.]HET7397656.1 hypothetical protein [Intrasporangium sp.]